MHLKVVQRARELATNQSDESASRRYSSLTVGESKAERPALKDYVPVYSWEVYDRLYR